MESLTWVLTFCSDLDLEPMNEELHVGRNSTRDSSLKLFFCECKCKSVELVLWACSEYSNIRKEFIRNFDGQYFTK